MQKSFIAQKMCSYFFYFDTVRALADLHSNYLFFNALSQSQSKNYSEQCALQQKKKLHENLFNLVE